MYTLESLKPLNTVYDSEHRLDQDDVDAVNRFVELIGGTRSEKPLPGDSIDFTDEYGHYNENTRVRAVDDETGQLSIRVCSHIPFIYREDNAQGFGFHNSGGGLLTSVAAVDLTYIGKREKTFAVFGHTYHPAHSAIYFQAWVNVWEYIAPNQKHPGYSTKDWDKQYISYVEKPADDSVYHFYGRNIAFRNSAEFKRWKATYKAVEFPGADQNHTILFLFRERSVLVSREEWDELDLPLDTRQQNGIIHVKVAYDDNAHVVTEYRFTNSGYLDPKIIGPYERAKGVALAPPRPKIGEK